MDHELFADEIAQIVFEGGVIRMDLVSHSPADRKDQSPPLLFKKRIVMPVPGFLKSLSLMEELAQKMKQNGVLTRVQSGTAPPTPGLGGRGAE